jgi:hypothetical protein
MKHVSRFCVLFGLAALLLVFRDQGARAEQVVLTDPLTSWPLNFGPQGSVIMLKDGAVHIVETQNYSNYITYAGFNFKDMDASLTVTATANQTGDAGMVFWSNGLGDYYYFGVSAAQGSFSVSHHTTQGGGTWVSLTGWIKDPSIKTGPTAVNTLRVVTKGNSVQLSINGAALGHLAVVAPATGGAVGILGEGSTTGTSDYGYSNLSVSQ